ncbi:MAG: CxxC-x17-CxxC domain-containing protein [Candidatus Dojkabacteria bacterium]
MGRFPQNRNSGGRSFGGGGRSERPTMHDAVCDKCGKPCQVPFQPSGSKPVFCSSCFEREGNGSSDRRESRSFGRSDSRRSFGGSEDRQMFSAVCDKCGNDCEVPFKPSSDKPIYCSRCFETMAPKREERGGGFDRPRGGSSNSGADLSQLKEQLNSISGKLDKLVRILTPVETIIEDDDVKEEVKEVVKKTVKKPKKAVAKKKATSKVLKKEVLNPL